MDADVHVLVLERGLGLTHDFTLACRHSGVSVLGPVRDATEARTAASDVPVDVLAVELEGPRSRSSATLPPRSAASGSSG